VVGGLVGQFGPRIWRRPVARDSLGRDRLQPSDRRRVPAVIAVGQPVVARCLAEHHDRRKRRAREAIGRLVADLVPYVPPDLTWAEVVPKLRCSQCGEQADIVGLSGWPKASGGGSAGHCSSGRS
jgi:hypothetical protein